MTIRKTLEPIWRAWDNKKQSAEEVMGLNVGNDKLLLIKVEGMHCHKCEQTIRKALTGLSGVHEVEVDFPSRQASVLFDPATVTPKQLTEAVAGAGYKV